MSQPIIIQLNEEATKATLQQMLPAIAELIAQQQQKTKNRALTVREAAEQLDMSDDVVRKMVERGALIRVPGITEIRIRQSELDALGTSQAKRK